MALPGSLLDANRDPAPAIEIPNAAIVLNITDLQGFANATFTYGSYGRISLLSEIHPPPAAGTLFTVSSQRVTFSLARSGTEGGSMTVQTDLIGDFCLRAPTETICKDHNVNATTPPMTEPPKTSLPNVTSSAPSATKPTSQSMSARRVVLSSLVTCLAVASAAIW